MTSEQIRKLALKLYTVVFECAGDPEIGDLAALPSHLPNLGSGAADGYADQ
jgi:hypothetical protein